MSDIVSDVAVSGAPRRTPVFTAVQTFGPWSGEPWRRYLARTGLDQLVEVVTFDRALCPCAVPDLRDKACSASVEEERSRRSHFTDLSLLLRHVDDHDEHNILGLIEDPGPADLTFPPAAGFVLRGFDLVEHMCDMSVLTSRGGGYDRAFTAEDLNFFGLIDDLQDARNVRERLLSEYPHDPCADARVWAVWRLESPLGSGR
jgi:hypothetical protein